jgi:hypothetical protein
LIITCVGMLLWLEISASVYVLNNWFGLIGIFNELIAWLMDWLIDWLMDCCEVDGLIDWASSWLIEAEKVRYIV